MSDVLRQVTVAPAATRMVPGAKRLAVMVTSTAGGIFATAKGLDGSADTDVGYCHQIRPTRTNQTATPTDSLVCLCDIAPLLRSPAGRTDRKAGEAKAVPL